MTEIIARPATGARPGPARKKPKQAAASPGQPASETAALCSQAVGLISTLVARAAETCNIPALEPAEELDEADCLLMEIRDGKASDSAVGGLGEALRRAYVLLDTAASGTPEHLSADVGQAVFAALTIGNAMTLTKAVEMAFEDGDLERLRTLGTYQGAMEVAVHGRSARPAAPAQHLESFGHIAALLRQAARTDEPHAHSGDSDRLLRIGGEIAASAAACVAADDREQIAFDIAACVSASTRVPGDTQSPKRAEFIRVAAEFLAVLADTPITDILGAGLTQHPRHKTETGPSMPGLNLDQLRKVLGRVARDASTLNNLLMAAQATDDGTMLAYLVDGAQALTEKIGGMADQAVEGDVIGDYDSWFFGPNFGRRGGAA